MTDVPLRIIELSKAHKQAKEKFQCGSEEMDRYFKEVVSQDIRRDCATCYVALSDDRIVGFYTLSATSIELETLPIAVACKLPPFYDKVPAVLLGRLAVDNDFKRQGIGKRMIGDAIKRMLDLHIGCFALVVDAKNDMAFDIYKGLGFIPLESLPKTLFLPKRTAKASFPTR